MASLDTLYAIDKKGKVRVFNLTWDVDNGIIETSTGEVYGKQTINTTKVKPKGKKTLREQTVDKSLSLYKEKQNEGYKTKIEYFRRAGELAYDIKYSATVEDLLRMLHIQFNTNPDWLPLPMLAEKWKDFKNKVKYPGIVQPKLNGVRCIALKHNGQIKLLSREGHYYFVPHLVEALTSFFEKFPDIILDGEIYTHGVPLQVISGAVRTEENSKTLFGGKQDFLEYHVYDVVDETKAQVQREAIRLSIFSVHTFPSIIKCVHSTTVYSERETIIYEEKCLEEGYEGIMFREMDSKYTIGFRDKCLLKVKRFEDAEFEIVGFKIDPQKTVAESLVFELQNDINNKTFFARPTGTNKMKEKWYELLSQDHDNILGKKATVRFKDRSVDEIPLHGNIRHKDTKCLIEVIRDYE